MKRFIAVFLCFVLLLSTASCKTGNEKYENRYREINEVERNETGLTWPEGQALPSMAYVADNLDAIDITRITEDTRSMLASFQGIINREKPRVYLYGSNDVNEKWADEMGASYTITKDEDEIILKYKDEIKGLVVWDKKQRHTLNLATTYAGLNDVMVVTERLAEKYTAEPYNFPIVEDYRGRFEDSYEVYEYLYDNLWKDCSKRLVMGLSPYAGGHTCHSRDLAVAAKCAVLWIDLVDVVNNDDGTSTEVEKPEDIALLDKFFRDCTPGEAYYAGWWVSEGKGIEVSSKYGIPTVPADFYENYTIYAGASRELDIPTVPAKPELEGKYYIAFTISDGDNMQYCQHFMKTHSNMWGNSKRGEVPISWTCSPVLYDAGPQILNYYYRTATENDFLIAGPSGVGYTNPVLWESEDGNNDNYLKYIKLSDSYFRRTAFNFTTVWHQVNDAQAALIRDNWGSLLGYSTQSTMSGQRDYTPIGNGIVKIQTSPPYDGNVERVYDLIRKQLDGYSGRTPRFMMPQLIAWEAGVEDIVDMAEKLKDEFGDKIEFVRVDHLCMLYSEYMGSIYNASLQAENVTASGVDEGSDARKIVDGSFAKNNGWQCSDSGDKWITIDLKEEYKLSRYILQNAATGYYSKELNTKDFKIQASTDGENWTDIDSVTGNTSNIVDKITDEFTARYVRLYITDPGADGVARVQEFEVWGVKVNAKEWRMTTY